MASGYTLNGLKLMHGWSFRGATRPTTFALVAITNATTPTSATVSLSELTEIASGNGYTTGGVSLTPGATDFPTLDTGVGYAYMLLKDITLTATGGSIPSSGDPISYVVLVDDAGDPNVIAYFDCVTSRTISSGSSLTFDDLMFKLSV